MTGTKYCGPPLPASPQPDIHHRASSPRKTTREESAKWIKCDKLNVVPPSQKVSVNVLTIGVIFSDFSSEPNIDLYSKHQLQVSGPTEFLIISVSDATLAAITIKNLYICIGALIFI